MTGAPTRPAPTNALEPLDPLLRSRFQTIFPLLALTATRPPMSVPVKTQPSASVGTDWIRPPSGMATFHARPRVLTLAVVIVFSAVWARWLSSDPPYSGQSPPAEGAAQPAFATAGVTPRAAPATSASAARERRVTGPTGCRRGP